MMERLSKIVVQRNQYGDYVMLEKIENKEDEMEHIIGAIKELMESAKKTIELKKGKHVPGTAEIIIRETEQLQGYFSVGVKFTMEEPGDE